MTYIPFTTEDQRDYADGIAPNALAFLETLGLKITTDGVDVADDADVQMALQMATQVVDAWEDDDTCYHWLGLSGDDDLDYGGSYVIEALEPVASALGIDWDYNYDSTALHARIRAWGLAQGHHTAN